MLDGLSPSIPLYSPLCSIFRKLGSTILQSAARNAVKTSRRPLARCRALGLLHIVRFAARRGAIFPPRSFEASSRTNLVLNLCDRGALMGEMKRAIAREREAWAEKMQEQMRMNSTLVIAAAIIAAVRLAWDPDISRPSPRLASVVSESVNLARMILDRVGR